jgi:hypothetical protein
VPLGTCRSVDLIADPTGTAIDWIMKRLFAKVYRSWHNA